MTKLFLDDIRSPKDIYPNANEGEYVIVRSYDEFVTYIKGDGLPQFISFDNDLGLNEDGEVAKDGLACAKWLVYESRLDLKDLQFKVHSANIIAAPQIKGLLDNYIVHLNED